jgi:asparagine synthase (glutamine-hydrolysing)
VCGICGLAGRKSVQAGGAAESSVEAALNAMRHRGPDGEGTWRSAEHPVVLGHLRLAIIDLTDAAAQPMTTEDGAHAVTFNGEIYNYRELRARLEQLGHRFRTASDTEVLLSACREWGPLEAARRAHGMFAFAYLDGRRRRLWLVRDRFGEKPLYWTVSNGSVAFASEPKGLTALTGSLPEIDRNILATYLARSVVPQPATIYRNVFQVAPGGAVSIELSSDIAASDVTTHVHWDAAGEAVRARMRPFSGSLDEAVEAVHERLSASVRASTVSDVPVGAFLSGGVDSTLVTALMQQGADRPVRTFTIGFDDPRLDESGYATKVAAELGTDHSTVVLSPADVLAVVPELASMYDEPFADASQLPTHMVSQVARRDVTVALSGDGGDELFGGYNRHITSQRVFAPLSRVPARVRGLAGSAALGVRPSRWDSVGRAMGMHAPTGGLGARVHKLAAMAQFTDSEDLYDRLTAVTAQRYVLGAEVPLPPRLPALATPTESFMLGDAMGYLSDDILVKVDRAAMAVSLETRIPMLDPDVYRLAWSLPLEYKVSNGVGKLVLRRLLGTLLPEALMNRPKMGFGLPLDEWLRGPLRPWAEDLLSPGTLREQGLLDVDAVRDTWQRHASGERDHSHELWNIIMFQSWLDRWSALR